MAESSLGITPLDRGSKITAPWFHDQVIQRRLKGREAEAKAMGEQRFWQDALAREQRACKSSECDFQSPRGSVHEGRPTQSFCHLSGQIGIPLGLWGGGVDRPGVIRAQHVQHPCDQILDVNPGHPLASVTQAAAHS